MKTSEQIELILVMTFVLALIPCGITYWISGSIIYTLIPFMLVLFFAFNYTQNTKDRKEVISIFQKGDDIHLMLDCDNWHTIKTTQSSDIANSILDRLNANLAFVKSHIKRIDLVNIDNKPLQEQLNRLLVA